MALLHNVEFHFKQGTLFISPYWVGFFVQNYQDHFRRRALIGTFCRLVWPLGVNTVAINVISSAVLVALLVIVVRCWRPLAAESSNLVLIFTFAFFAGPIFGILFEVLGDPLQFALLAFLAVFLWAKRLHDQPALLFGLGLLLICIAFLVHEASIFFLVPALPFFVKRSPRVKDFVIPSVLLVALLALSFSWSHVNSNLTYHAVLFPRGGQTSIPIETPDFKTLLSSEQQESFSSTRTLFWFIVKFVRLGALTFVGVLALAVCLSIRTFKTFLAAFLCISFYNVPLWIIAHDWARFLSYSFVLALVAAAVPKKSDSLVLAEPAGRLTSMVLSIRKLSADRLLQLAVLFVLLEKPGTAMRIAGLANRELATLAALIIVTIIVWRRSPPPLSPVKTLDEARP